LVFALLSYLPQFNNKFQNVRKNTTMTTRGFKQVLIGGAILGSGMTISGACPGMILVQVGSGVTHALWTFIGCNCGALFYGLLQPYIPDDGRTLADKGKPSKSLTLDQVLKKSFLSTALPVSAVLWIIVLLCELFAPWRSELKHLDLSNSTNMSSIFRWIAWNPILSGIVVGLLQFPGIVLLEKSLGTSGSYMTFVSQFIPESLLLHCDLLQAKKTGLGNWWQCVYVGSAILGAYFSSSLSNSYGSGNVHGIHPLAGLVGGFFLIFGSQYAGGCTSGHGLSGMAFLSLFSMAAVVGMFASGIGYAFLFRLFSLI